MKSPGNKERGSIGAVLIVTVIALGLVLTVAALATTHLNLSNRSNNAIRARTAAESLIQEVVAHLLEDPAFGHSTHPSFTAEAASMQFQANGVSARLAFDPAQATALEIPPSLNNVESDSPLEGWGGRVIPSEAIQLVAVGECGGVQRTIETVLHIPRFPYVVCTSGRFESQGPMVVGVMPEGAEADWVTADELLPGHLASNSSSSNAISLRDAAVVTGDVESAGGIDTLPPVVIQGSRLENSAPVSIPDLRIQDYDPEFRPGNETFTGAGIDTTLAGYNRGPGSVTVSGDLNLEAAVLYVAGDLLVTGNVTGRGAIFTEGNLEIRGLGDIEADQQVALVAEGDVQLQGGGRFRGVVYTKGDFSATGVALVGAFISNSGSGGTVRLRDVGVLAGDPNMSFEDNWLVSQTLRANFWGGPDVFGNTTSWPYPDFYPPDFPTWRQSSEYVGMSPDGLVMVDWTFHGSFPEADEDVPTIYPRREFYDTSGNLVRIEWQGPGGIAADGETGVDGVDTDPTVPGSLGWGLSWNQDGALGGYLNLSKENDPGMARPQRVQVIQEVADFRLDFSQFFSYEDRMRTILWVEH